jgi:hypothetical protein
MRRATPADPEYEELSNVATQWLDCSKYPRGHPLCNPANAYVPGLFKDESGGREITLFMGLRPKVYTYLEQDTYTKGSRKGQEWIIETTHAKGTDKVLTTAPKDVDKEDDHADRHPDNMAKDVRKVLLMDFRRVMFGEAPHHYVSSTRLVSRGHRISTWIQERKAMDAMNTKRFLLGEHGIDSVPYGYRGQMLTC